jgi:2'-5' RNA ligase
MNTSARIFVGLPVDVAAAHELAVFARRALGGLPVRPVEPAQLHATLVFCGPVDDDRVDDVAAVVEEETPFDLAWTLTPTGVRQLGSVVAITYEAPADLVAIQRALERRLVGDGLAPGEGRRWLPHVTVARGRQGARFRAPRPAPPPLPLRGAEVVVYRSEPAPTGTVYTRLATLPRPSR